MAKIYFFDAAVTAEDSSVSVHDHWNNTRNKRKMYKRLLWSRLKFLALEYRSDGFLLSSACTSSDLSELLNLNNLHKAPGSVSWGAKRCGGFVISVLVLVVFGRRGRVWRAELLLWAGLHQLPRRLRVLLLSRLQTELRRMQLWRYVGRFVIVWTTRTLLWQNISLCLIWECFRIWTLRHRWFCFSPGHTVRCVGGTACQSVSVCFVFVLFRCRRVSGC